MRTLARLLCVLILGNSDLWGDDWTEFRGPQGQGHSAETTLPVHWSADENVAWRRELPGRGWSSPVVLRGKIYLTAAVPVGPGDRPAQSLHALCVDAQTGAIDWDVALFEQPAGVQIHGKNSHASSSPVTDGNRLYVHFGTHGTACLELDGTSVWKTTELKYSPVHGNGGSPVLFDDLLIVNCDGSDVQFVVALDQATGRIAWRRDRGLEPVKGFSFCTPLLVKTDDQFQLITAGASGVFALSPRTGEEIWRVRYPGGYSVVPRPVAGHGMVYVCTGYDSPALLAIRLSGAAGDVTDSHVAWKLTKRVPLNPSPLLTGDAIYLVSDDGILSCVDALSGETRWQHRLGGSYSASPTLAGGKLYIQSEAGETYVVEPGLKYQEAGRSQIGDRTFASYAIAEGAIFLRSEQALWRIQAAPPRR